VTWTSVYVEQSWIPKGDSFEKNPIHNNDSTGCTNVEPTIIVIICTQVISILYLYFQVVGPTHILTKSWSYSVLLMV
jgi:hypothetical protein